MIAFANRIERVPEFSALLLVAAHTGARRGELCALTWADVDSVDSKITIRHAIGTYAGGTEVKDPKTHAIREVELGPLVLDALIERKARAIAAAELVGRTIDTRGDRTLGTLLGAAGGALLGREIDRSGSRCR